VLNVATGEEVTRLNAKRVRRITLDADGKYVATAAEIGDVRLWDARSGQQLVTLRDQTAGYDNDLLSFSPDGKRLINGLGNGRVHVWEVSTGQPVGPEHGTYVKILDFQMPVVYAISPSGDVIIMSGTYPNHQLSFTNLLTGEVIAERHEHANTVFSVAITRDGRHTASASQDGTVRIWDARTGQPLQVLRGHRVWVTHVAFTADGSHLISTSIDETSRIWNVSNGELESVCYGGQSSRGVASLSPNGALLASADWNGIIRVWALDQPRTLRGHGDFVYDAAFSPDGAQIVSGSWDNTIRFWDARTGHQSRLLRSDRGPVFSVAFSPDGRTLASGWQNSTISLWDIESGSERHFLGDRVRTFPTAAGSDVAFGPRGIVAALNDDGVRLYDSQSGSLTGVLPSSLFLWSVAVSSDGRLLAAGGNRCSVLIWDLESRKLQFEENYAEPGTYTCGVAFRPDGKVLASCDSKGKLRVWEVESHREIASLNHPGEVYSVCFSPDGSRAATGCQDNSIRLWDTRTWQQVLELRGHTDYVHSVAFSPDGTQLVSASGDGTVRIWDTRPLSVRPGFPALTAIDQASSDTQQQLN
jgi:WD40 repeat protein